MAEKLDINLFNFSSPLHYLVSHDVLTLGRMDLQDPALPRVSEVVKTATDHTGIYQLSNRHTAINRPLPANKPNVFANTPYSGKDYVTVSLRSYVNTADPGGQIEDGDGNLLTLMSGEPLYYLDGSSFELMSSSNPPQD